jgi:hypothetical protein
MNWRNGFCLSFWYTREVHMVTIQMANPWKHPTTGMLYYRARIPKDVEYLKGREVHFTVDGKSATVKLGHECKVSLLTHARRFTSRTAVWPLVACGHCMVLGTIVVVVITLWTAAVPHFPRRPFLF